MHCCSIHFHLLNGSFVVQLIGLPNVGHLPIPLERSYLGKKIGSEMLLHPEAKANFFGGSPKSSRVPASSKGCCLIQKDGVYRHPLSSIQHPLEDPGKELDSRSKVYEYNKNSNWALFAEVNRSPSCRSYIYSPQQGRCIWRAVELGFCPSPFMGPNLPKYESPLGF